MDGRCPCTEQSLRTFAGRGPGGVNVVEQQNGVPPDQLRLGNKKSSAKISPPLVWRKSGLALGSALPSEGPQGQMHIHLRMFFAHSSRGMFRQQVRLIEAPLTLLRCVERHGNNGQVVGQMCEVVNGFRQKRAERGSNRRDMLILQQMNQRSQRTFVHAVCDGLFEGRTRSLAHVAQRKRRLVFRRRVC